MRVIFAAGATGGHIYPALAVADELKKMFPDMEALFVTSKRDISTEIIESNGYEVRNIDIKGINRKNPLKNFSVLKSVAVATKQIKTILAEFKPDFVFGTGGNVCGTVVRVAHKKGIPTFLQEQNALPGLSNKLAQKYVNKIFIAFEESREHFKDKEKLVVSGNPVRKAILSAVNENYREKLMVNPENKAVLIFGGSQGADNINNLSAEYLISIKDRKDIEVFFITGHRMFDQIIKILDESGVSRYEHFHVMEYAEEMHELYSVADIIIARSGALSVSEISVMGKPSILIPSPNVSGNHQYYNAKSLADQGAAIIIEESALNAMVLESEIENLLSNKEKLREMSEASNRIGHSDASEIITKNIIELIK